MAMTHGEYARIANKANDDDKDKKKKERKKALQRRLQRGSY